MKTLVIVRHGKSSWDDPSLSDHQRSLSKRGLKDAPLMGSLLAEWGPPVDRVYSSSAVRALTTAEMVLREMGLPWDEIQIEDDLYHATEYEMLDLIQEQDDYLDGLMLFGHNPGMTYLVNDLSNLGLDNLPTCGVAILQFEVASWSEIGEVQASNAQVDFPKNHR
jgi:phosphohistidine phosphatase